MRLLHFNHAGELLLEDFCGKTIPPYAILSHRWENSEILFEDIRNNSYEKKEGYRKIEFCAKQAAHDELRYIWIDTCCIDKWDLDELSEAINSMFHWYKNATKCYVYLSDVSATTATEATQCSTWEVSFRTSAWFTRGWTLQELIAPASVEFFSCEGVRIGDKTSLEQLVFEITGIPLKVLRNCPLDENAISERMKWAENRETTEEEDGVYCLLGILNIYMPTAYGEGRKKAWRRLQIELEAASSVPSIIPVSQNDYFVGRELQLAELEAKLCGDKQATAKTVAIVGPAGTGKSQLALEFAYRTRERNNNCSVFWIDASGIDSLYQSYRNIARKLDIPDWDNKKADIKQLVKSYLGRRDASKSLLIFDDADSLDLISVGMSKTRAASLIDYLPQSENCSILLTTTSSEIAERLASPNVIELGEMTLAAAQRMFQNYLTTPVSRTEQQEMELLLKELLHLPLAVVQAAAYINIRSITLKVYRSELAKLNERVLESSGESSKCKNKEICTEGPVDTTLLLSVGQICCDHPLAADYLFLAACVNRNDISLELLDASSRYEREVAIRTLDSYALITRRPAESALDIHQLVHRALREWLSRQGTLDHWTQRAIAVLSRVFPKYNSGYRSKWRRLLPHAEYALSHSLENEANSERTFLAFRCAMAFSSDGRYNEAEHLFLQIMETNKTVFGEDHQIMLSSKANLAMIFINQGRLHEAEELGIQAMEKRKMVLGPEHPDTLASMASVAITFWRQNRLKEAEDLNVQVMQTMIRVLGPEHLDTLTSMANLAAVYIHLRQLNEAENLNTKVLESRMRVLGSEHQKTLVIKGNQALIYSQQGRKEEAEKLFVQVIDTAKRVLGEWHPDTLRSMNNLAILYQDLGQWKEAEELLVQVIETEKKVLGDEHPNTLSSMNNLAFTFKSLGKVQQAISLMQDWCRLQERVLGPRNPHTISSREALAAWRLETVDINEQGNT